MVDQDRRGLFLSSDRRSAGHPGVHLLRRVYSLLQVARLDDSLLGGNPASGEGREPEDAVPDAAGNDP